jgi:hypothetical protein
MAGTLIRRPLSGPASSQFQPVKAENQPEASHAYSAVMAPRSVDSEYRSHDIEPRNNASCRSLRHHFIGGNTEAPE